MIVKEFLEKFVSYTTVDVKSRTTGETLEEDICLDKGSKYLNSEISLWGINNGYIDPEEKGHIVVYVEKIGGNK